MRMRCWVGEGVGRGVLVKCRADWIWDGMDVYW